MKALAIAATILGAVATVAAASDDHPYTGYRLFRRRAVGRETRRDSAQLRQRLLPPGP